MHGGACRRSRGANIEGKRSRTLYIWLNTAKKANVYGALRGQVGSGISSQWNAAFEAQGSARPTKFRGLKSNHGMSVIRADRASRADLQRLIARLQDGYCQVGLDLRLVL